MPLSPQLSGNFLQPSSTSSTPRPERRLVLSSVLNSGEHLPTTVKIKFGVRLGPEALYTGRHLAVLDVVILPIAEFEDMSGRPFCEPTMLQDCSFRLRSAKAEDLAFTTVSDVMRAQIPPGTLLQANSGYAVDFDDDMNVEPGDVLEVRNEVIEIGGEKFVRWVKRHGAAQEPGGSIKPRLSVISMTSFPSSEVVLPFDADCVFTEPFDPACYTLEQLVRMVREGDIELPVNVEMVATAGQEYQPLLRSMGSSHYQLIAVRRIKHLVVSDGEEILVVPEHLCDKIRIGRLDKKVEERGVEFCRDRLDRTFRNEIKYIWYPDKASFSAMLLYNMILPD